MLVHVLFLNDVDAFASDAVARVIHLVDRDTVELRRDVHDLGRDRCDALDKTAFLLICELSGFDGYVRHIASPYRQKFSFCHFTF